MLSLSLYQQNSMPRNQVIEIQKLVSSLLSSISISIEQLLQPNEIKEDLECILNFSKEPFKEFKTEHRLFKMLKDLNLYEYPKSFTINSTISEIITHGNPTLGPKSAAIYVMPVKFTFRFQIF